MILQSICMGMTVKTAKERMKIFFMGYESLLCMNGMKQVAEKNFDSAIRQDFSVIKPLQLKKGLKKDIVLLKFDVKDVFHGFMTHVLDLCDAFDIQ